LKEREEAKEDLIGTVVSFVISLKSNTESTLRPRMAFLLGPTSDLEHNKSHVD
jgi:hypothetical protein